MGPSASLELDLSSMVSSGIRWWRPKIEDSELGDVDKSTAGSSHLGAGLKGDGWGPGETVEDQHSQIDA